MTIVSTIGAMYVHIDWVRLLGMPAAFLLTVAVPAAVGAQDRPDVIELREALVINGVGRGGRSPVHTDAVEAMLVAGTWSAPADGDVVELPDGSAQTWTPLAANDEGWFRGPAMRGGYALIKVESETERPMILHARGHSMVYFNGKPRGGDPYNYGFVRLPVLLRAGVNELLFSVRRGGLRARLVAPQRPVMLNLADRTMPDLVIGEDWALLGGVVVVNATTEPLEGLTLVSGGDGLPTRATAVPLIPPLATRKVPFWCGGAVDPMRRECDMQLRLEHADGRVLHEATVRLAVRRPDERHRRTFRSDIDGSVQYYAVTPPSEAGDEPAALFLTLHGAGVEASGQAAVYKPKRWGYVVAPTNRRKFGFDWEDWGRLDALEVLAEASARYPIDPSRIYLTGHSMGGHGVWHLGATFPDRFAAIGPSAGWMSFWSYTGATRFEGKDPVEAILTAAATGSDTRALARNYLHSGVYILHGEKDDNVPVEQARMMRGVLEEFHPDLAYHEEPGAGHWWGNRCCDWPAMFDFFEARRRPAAHQVDHVEFITANPAVSASCDWVVIEAVKRQGRPGAVVADIRRDARRIVVRADNVARLVLDLDAMSSREPLQVVINDQLIDAIAWPSDGRLRLIDRDGGWMVSAVPPDPALKGPHRSGPFKDAFRNRMVFVYGTMGSVEAQAWAYAKARYDAETFWYRGNGAVDLVADVAFDAAKEPERNVILYGNADTNAAWGALLGETPVVVRSGEVIVGDRTLHGDDLACLLVRPRPGARAAMVAAVTGTGPAGLRLTDRLPYFVSGVAYPDLIVLGPEMLAGGVAGVRCAGFFGVDWSVEAGDFAWR